MATYPFNKERINYSRLCRAIVDVCTDVFRDILLLQRLLNPKDVETELKKCAGFSRFKSQELKDINTAVGTGSYKGFDITMLYQIFRVLFTQDLRDNLMATVTPSQICSSVQNCSALSTGSATKLTPADTKALNCAVTKNSYDELGDELLWKLYSQLCSTSSGTILIHPTEPWGKPPAPGALTLGDDIERIRILRNTVYAHIKTTEVSDVDFNRHWTSLENIAIRIDSKIGTGYKKCLDDIKISSLDLGAEKKFSDQLKKLAEDLEQNVSDLKTEITTVKSEQGAMATDMDTVKYNLNRSVKRIKVENKQTKRVTTRLQRDVGQLKSSFQDPVPVHLRQRYNVQLEEWEKEDDVFTETRAYGIVRNAIDTNTFVTVFGNAGSGKSAIVHHLALEFKSIGYDVLPVEEPDDIKKYLQIDQKQLFVYDDPVGVHCINRDKFMKWLDFKIESPEMTKNLRVLCSIRRQIVNESDFKSNCNILNKKVIDIQDDKNKLTLTEKIQMIRHHIDVRQINLTVTSTAEEMIDRQEESFPLVCKLFVSNTELHKTNDWTFFQNPFKLVLEDLEKMKLHDKIKYCIIILCLVSKNRLDPELYTPGNPFELTREKQFINACGLTCESIIAGFQNGVESLVNVYLKWQNGMLSLSHDLISDVISYHFGQKYPKLVLQFFPSQFISRRVILGRSEANDPYVIRLETKHIHYLIDRMLIDFEKREFKNVFMNKCWSNDEFLDTFKATEENKIGGQPGKISPPVLEIFTEPQQPHKDIESEIQQISDRNTFSTWTWYYLALNLLKIPGVTALHWIATFGHGKLFTYVWDNLSWDQKAHVVHKIPLLHFTCLGGEMEIFNLVLKTESNKINTSISSESVVYPIHLATFHNEDIVQTLIKLGADINVKDCVDHSALFYAVSCNNIKNLNILIHSDNKSEPCKYCGCYYENKRKNQSFLLNDNEFNLNQTDVVGRSPLCIAAMVNKTDVAKLLILHQANVNLCDEDGDSPLHTAAIQNSVDVAKLLIQHQANVNLCDKDGFTPLHTAARHNSVDVAKLLILHQADVNLCGEDGYTPLLTAAIPNSVDVAKLLILHQADVNLCGEEGYTPLHTAALHNSVDVAKLLILHQANVNLCNKYGNTPLHTAALQNSVDVAKLLILHQADVNLCGEDGYTPLHTAAIPNSVDVAKLLILHQANVNLCDKYGNTPLHTAASNNSVDVAKLLILHQADVNLCGEDGYTPLHTAAIPNSVDVAKLLILHQANVNLCDKYGNTPLHTAALQNSVDVAKLLILHQADVNLCGEDGSSPLDIALENRFTDVANLLSNR